MESLQTSKKLRSDGDGDGGDDDDERAEAHHAGLSSNAVPSSPAPTPGNDNHASPLPPHAAPPTSSIAASSAAPSPACEPSGVPEPLHASPSPTSSLSEKESFATNVAGTSSKACLKFYSTAGCPYGESCHFSHYVPGGVASLALLQTSNLNRSAPTSARKDLSIQAISMTSREQGSPTAGGFKTRLCKNFESSEGCRFGSKCHFAHGELELKKSEAFPSKSDQTHLRKTSIRTTTDDRTVLRGYGEPNPHGLSAAAAFGAISTANVSINSSIAGFIIGKGGVNLKAISRATGAKLFIHDHESDPNLKNVEMQGSFDQIGQASSMVREMLANKNIHPIKPGGAGTHTYKSKLCENFPKGVCTYGARCHFAHGQGELHQAAPL